MEKNILEMPILEQMYHFRKEDIEQTIYDSDKEIQKIEEKAVDLNDELLKMLEEVIPKKEDFEKIKEKLQKYDLAIGDEIYFWSKTYYKLGINDMYKLKKELNIDTKIVKKGDTFLDYTESELDEYIQGKINFNSENYKAYREKCRELEKDYPKALKVFEDSVPIVLNKKEMEKLMELKKLDEMIRAEEIKVCFKLGINEILNF